MTGSNFGQSLVTGNAIHPAAAKIKNEPINRYDKNELTHSK